nr:MAG TPA: hypothetical protein [Caudoviricetes sp.]DAK76973.1 MAG TPA: hypothetical protein [Caudoviricetes sp.]
MLIVSFFVGQFAHVAVAKLMAFQPHSIPPVLS